MLPRSVNFILGLLVVSRISTRKPRGGLMYNPPFSSGGGSFRLSATPISTRHAFLPRPSVAVAYQKCCQEPLAPKAEFYVGSRSGFWSKSLKMTRNSPINASNSYSGPPESIPMVSDHFHVRQIFGCFEPGSLGNYFQASDLKNAQLHLPWPWGDMAPSRRKPSDL